MSTALAIAGVTTVLVDLFNNGIIDQDLSSKLGNVTVSALSPNRIDTDSGEKTSLNVFMYQATPNPGWRNAGLPSRDAAGDRITNPPLALDLHYLITAYGAENFHSDILLGYAMQLLHETPILTRASIRKSLAPPLAARGPGTGLPARLQSLSTTELAEQIEQIKIALQPMTTEEISRLWSALQSPYRPTAAYQVSVVLIESKRPTRAALPVRARNLYVLPFRRPTIAQLSPQIVLSGGTLTIGGVNLSAGDVTVRIADAAVAPAAMEDTQLIVTVPGTVPAGVRTAQVVQQLRIGTPPTLHRGFESNIAAFLLAPRIVAHTPPSVAVNGTLTVTVSPAVGQAQRAMLLIGDRAVILPPRLPTDPPSTTVLKFRIPPDVAPGTYLLRVEVDGAQSMLEVDAAGTQYTGPTVVITP